ncbi:MAG: LuxR C-terminal-related transcriptional regulator [Candidatus Methylomirabilales bacterium]
MEDILDFISNTADGVCAVDQEQKIVLWNEAAEKLLGFRAEEVLGRLCSEVIGGRDESGHLVCHRSCHNLMLALRQEWIPTYNLLARTKDGQEVWLSVSTILVPSRRKDLFVLAHLFRDVSRQKELERFVQQLFSSVAKLSFFEGTSPPMDPPLSRPPMNLTGRELEVLRLLASGVSTRAIAEKLFISPTTVRNHIHSILAKLGVHSRLEAVTLALRNGLI